MLVGVGSGKWWSFFVELGGWFGFGWGEVVRVGDIRVIRKFFLVCGDSVLYIYSLRLMCLYVE